MTDKQKEYLKYTNGILYVINCDATNKTPDMEFVLRPITICELCSTYFIPVNKPMLYKDVNNGFKHTVVMLCNNPDSEKFNCYIAVEAFIRDLMTKLNLNHVSAKDIKILSEKVEKEITISTDLKECSPSNNHLSMKNGYFDKGCYEFKYNKTPEITTGRLDISYPTPKQKDDDIYGPQDSPYSIMKRIMEDNPEQAEELFHALSDSINHAIDPTEQLYAAICDGQSNIACKGCHADRSKDCKLCSRNKMLRDMYQE